MTRSAKRQYISNLASDFKHNSSKFWKHFNHLSSHQKSQHLTNSDVTSEDINQHFLPVVQKTVSDLPLSDISVTSYINRNTDVSPLKLSEVDVQEVVECISHLDGHKVVGVDGILTTFVKASPVCIAMLLATVNYQEYCISHLSRLLEICYCNTNSKISHWFLAVQLSPYFCATSLF